LLVQQPLGGFLLVDDAGDVHADVGDEPGAEADRRVVGFDGILDVGDVDVGCLAGAVLLVAAEELGVLGAPPVDRVLNDHSLSDTYPLAAPAEHGALEVVVVVW
jgi:hypothetical protein